MFKANIIPILVIRRLVKLEKRGIGARLLNAVGLASIGQFEKELRNLNDPKTPISSTEILKLFGLSESESGVDVSYDAALTLSAVYRANKIICDTISSVPLNIYEKSGNGRIVAIDHDYQYLIHSEPNPLVSSFNWRHTGQSDYNFDGNDYSVMTTHKGAPVIVPIRPEDVHSVKRKGYTLYYKVDVLGKTKILSQDKVIHVKNHSKNGFTGQGYLTVAKETFGSGIAQRDYGSRFWRNNASSGLILVNKIANRIDRTKKQSNIDSWNEYRTGKNQHGTAILEGDWDVKNITVPQDQAQFIETANLSISDVGRFFGVPPHLLYDLTRSTFNNIEHQSIEFVTHSILGITTNRQQELDRKLFGGKKNNGKYFTKYNLKGLLQADIKSRSDFYRMAIQNSVMNSDEVRGLEDMNSIPEWEEGRTPGQRYAIQQNMMPLDQLGGALDKKSNGGGINED